MASSAEELPHQQQSPGKVAVPLWLNRSYLLLSGGQAISEVGTRVSDLAYTLLILALTHSPVQVGVVGVLELLPVLLLSLHAGALVDRWDRKRVMILCDTGARAAWRASLLHSPCSALPLFRFIWWLSPSPHSPSSLAWRNGHVCAISSRESTFLPPARRTRPLPISRRWLDRHSADGCTALGRRFLSS